MKIIFSDFDGTLTLDHGVGEAFFQILQLIENKQSELVIVSGRSLSWGHFFLTHFPIITAALMEGGGTIVTRNPQVQELMLEHDMVTPEELQHLLDKTALLLKTFSWLKLTKDSFGRRTDRAIELIEYNDDQKNQIFEFFKMHKVNFSCSNVHINFWAGNISKYNAVNYYLKNFRKNINEHECIYFGDAPNDESMFHFFTNSVGVSNIDRYLPLIAHKPKIILKGEENRGATGVLNYLKQKL